MFSEYEKCASAEDAHALPVSYFRTLRTLVLRLRARTPRAGPTAPGWATAWRAPAPPCGGRPWRCAPPRTAPARPSPSHAPLGGSVFPPPPARPRAARGRGGGGGGGGDGGTAAGAGGRGPEGKAPP